MISDRLKPNRDQLSKSRHFGGRGGYMMSSGEGSWGNLDFSWNACLRRRSPDEPEECADVEDRDATSRMPTRVPDPGRSGAHYRKSCSLRRRSCGERADDRSHFLIILGILLGPCSLKKITHCSSKIEMFCFVFSNRVCFGRFFFRSL